MDKEFYQVDWGNGNTDVFADQDDAIRDWQASNTADDAEYGEWIRISVLMNFQNPFSP